MDTRHCDNASVIASFKRFLKGMLDYLTINLGWSAEDARDYIGGGDDWKSYWIDGISPADAINEDLSYADGD